MANLTPTPVWDAVPQLEEVTVARAGPDGPMNTQAQALLNRTEYLAQNALRMVRLRATSLTFYYPASGGVTPSSITLTADPNGDLTHSPTFTVLSGTATLTGSGLTRTLAAADMLTDSVTIVASVGAYSDTVTITKVRDGQQGAPGATGSIGPAGAAGQNASLLVLLSTALSFTYDKAGAASPTSQTITFTAQLANLSGTPAFTCTLYDANGASLGGVTLGGSGLNRTLTVAQFAAAKYAVIQATLSGYTDKVSVIRLRDGENAVNGILTNESVSLAASSSGVVSSFAPAGGTFKVYDGTTDVTLVSSFSVASQSGATVAIVSNTGVYSVSAMTADTATAILRATYGSVTIDKVLTLSKSRAGATGSTGATGPAGPTGSAGLNASVLTLLSTSQAFKFDRNNAAQPTVQTITFTAQLANLSGTAAFTCTLYDGSGVSLGAVTLGGAGSNIRSLTAAQFGAAQYAVVQATLSGYSDQITVVRIRDGANGLSGLLTNESATLAANSSGVVSSFAPAGGTFKVYDGVTDVTTLATFVVVSSSGATASIVSNTGVYSVSAMSADTANVTFRATYGGVVVEKVLSLAKSRAGATGATGPAGAAGSSGTPGIRGSRAFYLSGYTSWNDAAATAAASVDGGPVLTDVVTEYSANWAQTRFWNGSAWLTIGQVVDGNLLVNGTVGAQAFVANLMQADNVLTRGLKVRDNSGNVILGIGSALPLGYVPAGALNSSIAISGGNITGIGTGNNTAVANSLLTPSIQAAADSAASAALAASAASDAAAAASASATTANNLLADIASDSKLTPSEKQQVKRELDSLAAEKTLIDAQASALGVSTSAFGTAYTTLTGYANPLVASLTTTSTIVGATFRSNFATYYSARQTILNAIAAAAATRATWANVTGTGRPADNATVGAPAGTLVNGVLAETLTTQASTAATNASAALTSLADIAADSKLTPVEKTRVRQEWDAIYAERAAIRTQADAFGVVTEKATYDTEFQALGTYLNGGAAYTIGATPPLWITDAQLSVTTTIVGATFRANWTDVYTSRQALLNKIASEASLRATWASVTGAGRPQDFATTGASFTPTRFDTLEPWTATTAGNPTSVGTFSQGTIVSGDADFGTCLNVTGFTNGGNILPKAVVPAVAGRVYRVTARFKVVTPSADGTMALGAMAGGMTASFAATSPAFTASTINVTDTSVKTFTALFSDTAAADVTAWPAGSAYLRLGFRNNSAETGMVLRVGSVVVEDVTEAYAAAVAASAASTAATNAANAASSAQVTADAANVLLADIASDAKLTPTEKLQVKRELDSLAAEKTLIDTQATALGVSISTFGAAYTALTSYANPLVASLTTTSAIVGATFRSNFATYYSARQTILNSIAAAAATKALWSNVTGTGRPQDGATVGAPAGTYVNGVLAESLTAQASSAASDAANAQISAASANALLSDIASDARLTPTEKLRIRQEWDAAYSERAGIRTQADTFGVTTEKASYDGAFQALGTYLNGGAAYTIGATPPLWITDAQLSVTTTIVGSTFRSNWTSMFSARQVLLNKLADVARTLANSAQSSATSAQIDATNALNFRLAKNAADTLSGTITLSTTGAIQTVNGLNSLVMGPTGIVGVGPKAGGGTEVKFSFSTTTGELTTKGDISGSTGTFVGSVSVNGATWGNGVTGFFAGMDSGFARLRIGSASQYLSYDQQTGVLQLKLSAVSLSVTNSTYSGGSTGSSNLTTPTFVVTASGGTGPYIYMWSSEYMSTPTGATANRTDSGNSCYFRCIKGGTTPRTLDVTFRCQVIDANGTSAIHEQFFEVDFL